MRAISFFSLKVAFYCLKSQILGYKEIMAIIVKCIFYHILLLEKSQICQIQVLSIVFIK